MIESHFRTAGVDPSLVTFEITETALMENLEAGEEFVKGLVAMGFGVALDDFGTGFGSFTYLKRLPIRFLKIDIDFVRDLVSNPHNQHLERATVGLARDFGYQTIAEGVEDAETLALLKELGVDLAQGYFLGRPAPLTSAYAAVVPVSVRAWSGRLNAAAAKADAQLERRHPGSLGSISSASVGRSPANPSASACQTLPIVARCSPSAVVPVRSSRSIRGGRRSSTARSSIRHARTARRECRARASCRGSSAARRREGWREASPVRPRRGRDGGASARPSA